MSTDIVERLRKLAGNGTPKRDAGYIKTLVWEAADEIERLRAVLVDVDELVDDYADADDGQPNLAMRIMIMVRYALGKAGVIIASRG